MTVKKSKILFSVCALVGASLILGSAFMIGLDLWKKSSSEKQIKEIGEKLYSVMPDTTDGVFDTGADPDAGMPVFVIEKIGYIGVLCAPSIDAEIPVADEYKDFLPLRKSGNAAAGSLVISGCMDGFENLYIGDTVQLYDVRGRIWSYSVCDVVRGEYEISEVPTDVSLVLSFNHNSTAMTVLCK